jgi:hypothetical protein
MELNPATTTSSTSRLDRVSNSNATDRYSLLARYKNRKMEDSFDRQERMKTQRISGSSSGTSNSRAQDVLKRIAQPQSPLERAPDQEGVIAQLQSRRGLSWFSGNSEQSAFSNGALVDPSAEYDKWAQAYRMLGGFIDKSQNNGHESNDKNGNNNNNNDGSTGCSRWMMWAAVRVLSLCRYM